MSLQVDSQGFYGEFGGAFIPEMLYQNIETLRCSYIKIVESPEFRREYSTLLREYVGRPTALYYARNLSREFNCRVYLKREDLAHTGSHKINNALGQALLAQRLGKRRIIAETGAGQHGVATASACALLGLECKIYMGELDMARQAPNVSRMQMLGASIEAVRSGSRSLKDATNQALRDWICNPLDTHYLIGSVVGPHPYPDLVARFQAVISDEIQLALKCKTGSPLPDYVVACIGGGSNAIGAFYNFIDEPSVKLIGVEAAGCGLGSGKSAAALALGRVGVLHGAKTILLQNMDGQITAAHSISAGLDYPAVGPQHAHLMRSGRAQYVSVTDQEALAAARLCTRLEGIIPALESAHAIAYLSKLHAASESVVVVNLSGRGDKDLATYSKETRHA